MSHNMPPPNMAFTCANYTLRAIDLGEFLPCPSPRIPAGDGFEWLTTGDMILPTNYTCSTDVTYYTVAPNYIIKQAVFGLIFLILAFLPLSWVAAGLRARNKPLHPRELNQQERMIAAVGAGSFCQFLAVTVCDWYYSALGPPTVTLFLQCLSALFIDSVLVFAVTGWTAMNNIQGKKPTIPIKYRNLKNVVLGGSCVMQLFAVIFESMLSLNGDSRTPSALNENYTYYDGTLSSMRQLANLLTEGIYVIVLLVEGSKLRKTLKEGAGEENPAAKKVAKYINICTGVMPFILLYRSMIIMGRLGATSLGVPAIPCSTAGSVVSIVDMVFMIVYIVLCFMLKPASKSKKVKPSGSSVGSSTETEKD